MSPAAAAFLGAFDAHLARIGDPGARVRLIESERDRVDRLERALADWAACDRAVAPQPTRFSAFDLALLHGALTMRLQAAREARGQETPAEANRP